MNKPVALIAGVGDGTGAALARRFAKGGYQVAMLARNRNRQEELERELSASRAFECDLAVPDNLIGVCQTIRGEMGLPEVLVHNAVRATFQTFIEADPDELEKNFRVNTTSLLHMVRELAPAMVERGHGAIMVTGNTAARRGLPTYAMFAPTKAAQRILAQSIAKHLGPKGVHVAYIVIDAAINTPWTRDRFYADKPEDFFSHPEDIAEEVYHVAHQPRSTWAFDVEIRPFGEKW